MKKIIVVDDSSTARMFVKRCLEIAGFREAEFLEASNGREALSVLKEHSADLVVSDLNMPVLDGEMLLKWMKSSPKFTETPIVIITSAGNPAKEMELMAMGALAVLSKPVSPADITEAMGSLLQEGGDDYA